MEKITVWLILFIALTNLNACFYISDPDMWPNGFVNEERITPMIGDHKDHVLRELGTPPYFAIVDDSTYYVYEYLEEDTALPTILYLPIPDPMKGTAAHCAVLEFDKNDRLANYVLLSEGYGFRGGHGHNCKDVFVWHYKDKDNYIEDYIKRIGGLPEMHAQEIRRVAEKGNAEAIYMIFLSMRDNYKDPVAAWQWLCKSADLEYKNAQYEIAYWFNSDTWQREQAHRKSWLMEAGVRPNDLIAYRWYSLAAESYDEILRAHINKFSSKLTEEEITEVKEMVRNWKPGQCQSDLQTGRSKKR